MQDMSGIEDGWYGEWSQLKVYPVLQKQIEKKEIPSSFPSCAQYVIITEKEAWD